MPRRTSHIEIGNRRAIAEMVVHHLLGVERSHENIAMAHVDQFARIFLRGLDVLPDYVAATHVWAVTRERLNDFLGKVPFELFAILAAQLRFERHDMPAV